MGAAEVAVASDNTSYEGLALEDILPFSWQPGDFAQSAALEHANEDTARALQAIAVYEDTPRSPKDDMTKLPSDNARVEAKLDLVLSLVARIVSERMGLPDPLPVILRSRSLEWQAGPDFAAKKGDTGFMSIWANAHIPLPLCLPCRIDQKVERNGFTWWRARIEFLAPSVGDGLDQVIFRHHRRQIAIARGTMVPGSRPSR
jgi:hypothetical protein